MLKETLSKNAGPLAAIGAIGGFFNDVLKPFANFALVFFVISITVGIIALLIYVAVKNKEEKTRHKEKSKSVLSFSIIFGIIWLVFLPLNYLTPDEGVLASNFEGIADLQKSLLNIEGDVSDIKESVGSIDKKLDSITMQLTQVDRNGGVISSPETPQDYYNNAVLYKLKGENENARKAFEELFTFNVPYFDPHLEYAELQTLMGARKELQEYYADLLSEMKQDNSTPYNLARLMNCRIMEDRSERIDCYQTMLDDEPEFAPLLYSLIEVYSWTNNRNVSTIDRREQKTYIEQLEDLPSNKRLSTYFVNIDKLSDVQDLIDNEKMMVTEGGLGAMVETPVAVNLYPLTDGEYSVFFLVYDTPTYIWYRFDGVGDFVDTGEKADTWGIPGNNRQPESIIQRRLTPGKHNVEVKYQDINGSVSEVYEVEVEAE